jgi:type I restriction-modification system DNA methylase subunit
MSASNAPKKVLDLVARFEQFAKEYQKVTYKEAQVRQEFIDPLFRELGWDLDNTSGEAEAYKEVIHEDALEISGKTKAPDYSFRVGGIRKFFLEAKKPSVNLKEDISPAFQVRRYAWSAHLPLSILTDFEEFAVYDCRERPLKTDKASTARLMFFKYSELADKWQELSKLFSRDAVNNGSLDKFSEEHKRGKETVDDAFLKEIESFREDLAKDFAKHNPSLSVDELNYAVTKTIDRIIFLRIAEDRGIEEYGRLQKAADNKDPYQEFLRQCRLAEQRYNSGLFHFVAEKEVAESPDTLTPKLKLDSKVFGGIIERLYFPESPYEFSVLPIDILGQVYEQFLGKVIRLTDGHRAKVEYKHEVKKAGGVYYTPTYIVDYIVKNTVGKLIEDKTPAQIAKLTILDPACGSGSFLIGAYTYLLNWHRDWYIANKPEKHPKEIFRTKFGEWHLTTELKRNILTNNIYGVDIDAQAVEVTKLSLSLKVLEGESSETIGQNQRLFHERVLPDLSKNIKLGNSLIEADYYSSNPLLGEISKIDTFDWASQFSEIKQRGGFDAIIGNPPYIRIQILRDQQESVIDYYEKKYISAHGKYDLYVLFIERAAKLLGKRGLLGFIVPNKILSADYALEVRKILSAGSLVGIVNFRESQVFENATIYSLLLFWQHTKKDKFRFCEPHDLKSFIADPSNNLRCVDLRQPQDDQGWAFSSDSLTNEVLNSTSSSQRLGNITNRIFQGIITGADNLFVFELVSFGPKTSIVKSNYLKRELKIESSLIKPFLRGSDVRRFRINEPVHYIFYPYYLASGKTMFYSEKEISEKFYYAWLYLSEVKTVLMSRGSKRMKYPIWYALWNARDLRLLKSKKILVPTIANQPQFGFDQAGKHFFLGSGAGGPGAYGITLNDENEENYLAVLGILNSSVTKVFINATSSTFSGGYKAYSRQYIEKIPIPDLAKVDIALKNKLINLVNALLKINDTNPGHGGPEVSSQTINDLEAQADKVVREMFNLR